jgi:TolA-binding protein
MDTISTTRLHAGAGKFQRGCAPFPDQPAAADALFWQGETLFKLGQYPQSFEAYDHFVRLYPDSPRRIEGQYGWDMQR